MYDELVTALRGCVLSKPCDGCPYYDPNGPTEKCATVNIAAADAIEELQADKAALNGTVSNFIGQIAELSKRAHVPPHGRLIDADEFLKRAIGTKCFRGDYALMLEELVGESTTIIPAEEGKT